MLQLLSLGIEDKIRRGNALTSYELVSTGGVRSHFADGTSTHGCLLVGADGIHSKVRRQLQPERKLVDTERQIIWARTWMTPQFVADYHKDAMTWFVGMDKQRPTDNVILEPIIWRSSLADESGGRLMDGKDYVYWSLTTKTTTEKLRTPKELQNFVARKSKDWNAKLKALFEYADWSLAVRARLYSSKPDIGDFVRGQGQVVLIGDAAHPMTPQGGLGGNTAVKSAADLCKTLIGEGLTKESIDGFERRIRALAKEAIEMSFGTAKFMVAGKDWEEYEEVDA